MSASIRDRLRWSVAAAVNRLPGTCWTDLVSFAQRYRRSPLQLQRGVCRADAARCGTCYCGKVQDPAGAAAWDAQVAARKTADPSGPVTTGGTA
jgi:hypothetical protein